MQLSMDWKRIRVAHSCPKIYTPPPQLVNDMIDNADKKRERTETFDIQKHTMLN